MNDYIISLLFGIIGLFLFHIYVQYNKIGRWVNKLKGPPILPVLGNLLDLNVPLIKIHQIIQEWANEYYPIFRIWLGNKAIIAARHPDDLEILLTSTKLINKDFAYEHFHPWMRTGLLISKGQQWHQRRKILTLAFHFNILKKYADITNEQADKTIKKTRSIGKESVQGLLPFCSKCTLNIICATTMGVSLDDEVDQESVLGYKDAVYKMGSIIINRAVRPYIREWMLPFLPHLNKERKEVLEKLDGFTDKIVKERREYHKSNNNAFLNNLGEDDGTENLYTGGRKKMSMLDLLLKAELDGLIDDAGIKDEVGTFVFEGHDTTAMGLVFATMLFAENKEIQNKARQEVESIMKRRNGHLETADLQELNYLERCLKETLRLFPSVPIITRYMSEDVQLKSGFVPKGSNVMLLFNQTFRDPNFWPEPERFDPDRFLPERSAGRHPFTYTPFSAGPRNCIGQKFAMMELKAVMARILYNFHLEPIEYTKDVKLITDVVLRPSEPVHAKFIRIDR